jgi:hypothetical protein
MNTAARLSVYGAVLALLTAGAYATGSAVGPFSSAAPAVSGGSGQAGTSGSEDAGHGDDNSGAVTEIADQPAGLASTGGGYTLTPTTPTLTAGSPSDFTFRITGPGGAPVTAFDEEQTKRLHLIVVRRDTTAYQHLHPTMDPDGTWRTALSVPAGGSYRAFADFIPTGGPPTTLGIDLSAAGDYTPATHPASRTARVDGYEVRLEGDLGAGQDSALTLTVTRDGAPVTDLEPYLGAYGHLVALREGDLAYLHVHPGGEPGDGSTTPGPQIRFVAEVPSTATYRLFLEFQHAGVVRTAEFTLPTTDADGAPTESDGTTQQPAHGHDTQDGDR